ncbi:nuclear transport factor 2 family protein [Zunongwangia sp. SCSIO 43204]|uniref:nuclear transport factor 2 family protein n=1 Tax=Zunongwangia sp. SCSIO 43204 TaxID=2779359 RepID=UPI001CA97E51|nr:nuclear transport factor 2 family protein [Zunongwangia sp. SCSIO 43204]
MEPIEKLLHIEEIKNLRIQYSHLLDTNQMEKVAGLFTEDAICQTDRTPWIGRDGIQNGLEKAFKDFDEKSYGSYPFMHAVTNHWVEITSPTTAKGRCYLIDLLTERPIEDRPLLLLGVYVDHYEYVDGNWKIKESLLDITWPQRDIKSK